MQKNEVYKLISAFIEGKQRLIALESKIEAITEPLYLEQDELNDDLHSLARRIISRVRLNNDIEVVKFENEGQTYLCRFAHVDLENDEEGEGVIFDVEPVFGIEGLVLNNSLDK